MKYLLIGLGNPGVEYIDTRHNIGFNILDALLYEYGKGVYFTSDRLVERVAIKVKGRTLILIKPMTYMNLSGKAFMYWLHKEKIKVDNSLVIFDDIYLPLGVVRFKKKGSAGGHNGMQNIIDNLGNSSFPRLKIGIGNTFRKGKQSEYVLGKWTIDEQKKLPNIQHTAIKKILEYIFSPNI